MAEIWKKDTESQHEQFILCMADWRSRDWSFKHGCVLSKLRGSQYQTLARLPWAGIPGAQLEEGRCVLSSWDFGWQTYRIFIFCCRNLERTELLFSNVSEDLNKVLDCLLPLTKPPPTFKVLVTYPYSKEENTLFSSGVCVSLLKLFFLIRERRVVEMKLWVVFFFFNFWNLHILICKMRMLMVAMYFTMSAGPLKHSTSTLIATVRWRQDCILA